MSIALHRKCYLLFIIKTANIFLLLLLDVETQSVAVTTKLLGEETKEALKRLGDLLSKDFPDLLHVGQCIIMKSTPSLQDVYK